MPKLQNKFSDIGLASSKGLFFERPNKNKKKHKGDCNLGCTLPDQHFPQGVYLGGDGSLLQWCNTMSFMTSLFPNWHSRLFLIPFNRLLNLTDC